MVREALAAEDPWWLPPCRELLIIISLMKNRAKKSHVLGAVAGVTSAFEALALAVGSAAERDTGFLLSETAKPGLQSP